MEFTLVICLACFLSQRKQVGLWDRLPVCLSVWLSSYQLLNQLVDFMKFSREIMPLNMTSTQQVLIL
jgi:hypothetical protein